MASSMKTSRTLGGMYRAALVSESRGFSTEMNGLVYVPSPYLTTYMPILSSATGILRIISPAQPSGTLQFFYRKRA